MKQENYLVRETFSRPNYLWLYWCLTIFGFFWLLLALVIDQLVTTKIKAKTTSTFTATEETYWCGWQRITSESSGLNDYKYTSCDSVSCATNNTAGEAWIAFHILAILTGYIMLGVGFYFDIRQGGFDMSSIETIAKKMGCAWTFGYTRLGTVLALFWQIMGLIIFSAVETCSKKEMWSSIILTISSFSAIGGASVALDIISLIFVGFGIIVLVIVRIQYGSLPKSTSLSGGVSNSKTSKPTSSPPLPGKTKEEPTEVQIQAPTTQAPPAPAEPPQSKLFNPSRTYDQKPTNVPKKETTTNVPKKDANANEKNNKPNKPPPMPGNKPKGPPPVPSKIDNEN